MRGAWASLGNCAELLLRGFRFGGAGGGIFLQVLAATAEAAVGSLCREQAFLKGDGTLRLLHGAGGHTGTAQVRGVGMEDVGCFSVTAHRVGSTDIGV